MSKIKLAILTSHPIQYQAPLFRKISAREELELRVYFQSDVSIRGEGFFDKEFNREIKWDVPLLDGYRYHFLKGVTNLLKWLVEDKPNFLLVYGWNSFTNWGAIFLSKLLGMKTLLLGESPLNQELMKEPKRRFVKKVLLGGVLFKLIDRFLYIGEENKKFYQYYGVPDTKLFFAPYAVDNMRFQETAHELKPKRDELREKNSIGPNDIVVLSVGKLIPKKRPLDTLKAFALLEASCHAPAVHVIFTGDGELRLALEAYVQQHKLENVHFVGFKNQTELPAYYTLADIFVLPSGAGETWGLVVNEAMNFGLPVVISDLPGSGFDLVHDGVNGFRFPVGDIEELSQKLKKLIEDETMRRRFGEESSKIIQGYSYEKDIEGLLRALRHHV